MGVPAADQRMVAPGNKVSNALRQGDHCRHLSAVVSTTIRCMSFADMMYVGKKGIFIILLLSQVSAFFDILVHKMQHLQASVL